MLLAYNLGVAETKDLLRCRRSVEINRADDSARLISVEFGRGCLDNASTYRIRWESSQSGAVWELDYNCEVFFQTLTGRSGRLPLSH